MAFVDDDVAHHIIEVADEVVRREAELGFGDGLDGVGLEEQVQEGNQEGEREQREEDGDQVEDQIQEDEKPVRFDVGEDAGESLGLLLHNVVVSV